MKKSFFTTVLLLAALFLPMAVSAQMLPQLPVDKDVRIGRLPNGLTYYIRHNEYPKGHIAGFVVSPIGEIHGSVLVSFGEILTFAGAVFGIDYRYKVS